MKALFRPFIFIIVLLMSVGMSSCFEPGDDILPTATSSATEPMLYGRWNLYAVASVSYNNGELHAAPVGAGVTIYDDYTLEITRKGLTYNGTWTLSPDGKTVSFTVDNNQMPYEIQLPGTWSVMRIDRREFWIKTGAKEMRFTRK